MFNRFMPDDNFSRMIQLATEFFDTKNDPSQLSIDETVIERLHRIHPSTMGERTGENGPIAWTIVIPTTNALMKQFIEGAIGEQELMELTIQQRNFDAVYLCSAMVLPEHRGKGLAKQLLCSSIRAIINDHSIRHLFYWAFSREGDALAQGTAKELQLPLLKRKE